MPECTEYFLIAVPRCSRPHHTVTYPAIIPLRINPPIGIVTCSCEAQFLTCKGQMNATEFWSFYINPSILSFWTRFCLFLDQKFTSVQVCDEEQRILSCQLQGLFHHCCHGPILHCLWQALVTSSKLEVTSQIS